MTKQISSYLKYIILFIAISITSANASNFVGSINNTDKYAKVCKDSACSVFGRVNFSPSPILGATSIIINDTSIIGNAWGDEIGWINMSPTGLSASDVLKVDPNTGVVTGKAYSSAGGWINFSAAGAGVSLIDNGSGSNFSGYAWVSGIYGGWLKFDCANASTCVKTDWRTIPNRNLIVPVVVSPTSGGLAYIPDNTQVIIDPIIDVLPVNQNIISKTFSEIKEFFAISPEKVNNTPSISKNAQLEVLAPEIPPFPVQIEKAEDSAENYEPEGRHREIFPFLSKTYESDGCLFCIVVRRDSYSRATTEGDVVILGEKRILKYGFVPKAVEVPISYSLDSSKLKVDLTSTVITATGAWAFRRYFLIKILSLFVR